MVRFSHPLLDKKLEALNLQGFQAFLFLRISEKEQQRNKTMSIIQLMLGEYIKIFMQEQRDVIMHFRGEPYDIT